MEANSWEIQTRPYEGGEMLLERLFHTVYNLSAEGAGLIQWCSIIGNLFTLFDMLQCSLLTPVACILCHVVLSSDQEVGFLHKTLSWLL